MNYAIIRVAKRSLGQAAAMARHALREQSTPNADPSRLEENTVIGPRKAAEVVLALKSRTQPFVKRRDAVRVLEFFIGASPEAMAKMSRKAQDSYFVQALNWLSQKFGGDKANVVSAVVHRDETTPHLQVLLTPIVDGKLAANQVLGGPAGLKKLQDEFSAMASIHGLRRGEKGSRAKHTTIRQFYQAIHAAGTADALPARVPIPPEPAPLTMFAGAQAKKNHAKALAVRQKALEANKARETRLIELARVGLAVQGRARRSLPGRLSQVEQLEAETISAKAISTEARELIERLNPVQQEEVISKARDRLATERAAITPVEQPQAQAARRLSVSKRRRIFPSS